MNNKVKYKSRRELLNAADETFKIPHFEGRSAAYIKLLQKICPNAMHDGENFLSLCANDVIYLNCASVEAVAGNDQNLIRLVNAVTARRLTFKDKDVYKSYLESLSQHESICLKESISEGKSNENIRDDFFWKKRSIGGLRQQKAAT